MLMSDHPSFWKPPLRQGTAGPLGKSAAMESPDSSIDGQSIFRYPLVLGNTKKGFQENLDKIHVNPRSTWTRWARPSGLRCSRPTLKRQKLLTTWVAEIHVSQRKVGAVSKCFLPLGIHRISVKLGSDPKSPVMLGSGAASKWLASG